jgi:uncharacterized protein (DUF488 family)
LLFLTEPSLPQLTLLKERPDMTRRATAGGAPLRLWTVGHSTRPFPDFLAILAAHEIEVVADVRRYPGSRSQPQYNSSDLERSLPRAGVDYLPLPELGGRRRPATHSVNTGWRHPAFRGYADYIAGEEFAGGLEALLMVAWGLRTAVMCAEAVWWRCHRRIIADVVVSLGARVIHIMDITTASEHRLTPPARLSGGALPYRAG